MDLTKVSITEKRQIAKYAEGAVPGQDAPFEVIEEEHVYEGEEALAILQTLKVKEG